jgi:hypothetical protein
VSQAIEKSVHIIRSDALNIPSEPEQKRDAVRSYIEDTPDTPGRGADGFTGPFPAIVSDIQRGCVPPESRPVRGFGPHTAAYSAVSYNRPTGG